MRLILHADDFGASADTVRATIECFEQGVLTSASIMPGMPATAEATEFARSHTELDFGVHLTFVGDEDERPLSPADEIPALVTESGRFRPTRQLRARALLRRLPVEQIERELVRQLEAIRETGVEITHVDSHRHMHKLPSFRRALERVLPRFGIRRVRAVQDVYVRRPVGSPTYWLGPGWQRRLARRFATTDHFYMPTTTSDAGWERSLLRIAERLTGSTMEVGVHPGYDTWRDDERSSVVSFAMLARDGGHELVAWKDIA
jgi:chitin disaccharide deacetylase